MSRRTRQALGHTFEVTTPVTRLDDHLDALLSDLPSVGDAPGHRYEIVGPDGRGRWVARCDGVDIEPPGEAARALALLLWRLNRGVIEETGDLVLLHAGGVVIGGEGVLLPGAMEVGKTTLVTGLLRTGAGYLSDEAVGVDLREDVVRGYAKPLSLDPGSWPLFPELEPDVPGPIRDFMPHQWQVRASSLPDVEVVPQVEPGLVVFPRFVPGAAPGARRLQGAEALFRLSGCVFPTRLARRHILERLASVVRVAPCYELTYGDLADGVAAVEHLAGAGGQQPAVSASGVGGAGVPGRAGGGAAGSHRAGGDATSPESVPSRVRDQDVYARRRDAAIIDVGDEVVVHVAATDALHRLDRLGAALWERFDGRRSLRGIIEDLASSAPDERPVIAATVRSFVADLAELGLLE